VSATDAPKAPLLARVGVRYFEARSSKVQKVEAVDAIHFLNAQERAAMLRVQAGAIFRAFMAGAISGGISAGAEVFANPLLPDGASPFSRAGLQYWAILGGATLVASVAEILFLYWDTLRSVHQLATVAGLELFGRDAETETADAALADALARAALELPNPVDQRMGVDPHRESKKWRLVAASVAYKAKVGVTNFVLKLLVRRLLGRVAVRGVLGALVPFVAVPVTAAWNGVVTWLVLKEARVRAMGPSAIDELMGLVFNDVPTLSDAGKLAAVRAVASAIVRTQDLHPNLVRLLSVVSARAGDTGQAELDDVGAFLASLHVLATAERKLALQVLAVACIVDGRLTSREESLWEEAVAASERRVEVDGLERLRRAFVAGDAVADDVLRAL
jgi:hypothetical protein